MSDDLGFIEDIIANPEDPVPRLVYADWLDERSDPRGEFLRLEARFRELPEDDNQREAIRSRLEKLRERIDPSWLAQLDRTVIENCGLRFTFQCPLRWEKLQPTDEERVRFCDSCGRAVYHCGSVAEARDRAEQGECVAVDSRLARAPGDLDTPGRLMLLGRIAPVPDVEEERPRPPRRSRRARQRRKNRRQGE